MLLISQVIKEPKQKFSFSTKWGMGEKVWWFILFLTAIFASALPGFNIPGIGLIYPFRILLPLFVLSTVKFACNITKLKKYSLLVFLAIIFYGVISLSWCAYKNAAVKALLNYIIMFVFSIVLVAFCSEKKRFSFALKSCSLIVLCLQLLGFIESITGHYFFAVDSEWFFVKNQLGLWSPITVFGNSNDFILMLVGYLPFHFIMVNSFHCNFRKKFVIKLIYVIITCYLSYAAQCRMGFLIIAIMLYAYLLLGKHHKVVKPLTIIFGLFFLTMIPLFIHLFRAEARWLIWKDVLKSAKAYFFLGVGVGNSSFAVAGIQYETAVTNPHFWFLEIFAEFGFIIFIMVIAWFIYIIRCIHRLHYLGVYNYTLLSVTVFLSAFVFLSMMSSSISSFAALYMFLCFIICIIDNAKQRFLRI